MAQDNVVFLWFSMWIPAAAYFHASQWLLAGNLDVHSTLIRSKKSQNQQKIAPLFSKDTTSPPYPYPSFIQRWKNQYRTHIFYLLTNSITSDELLLFPIRSFNTSQKWFTLWDLQSTNFTSQCLRYCFTTDKSLRNTKISVVWYLFTRHSWSSLGQPPSHTTEHHFLCLCILHAAIYSAIQNITYAPEEKDPAGLDNI